MHLLLLGATGLVGSYVLQQALSDARVTRVTAPTRRALATQPKLTAPVVDFNDLPRDASWWRADAMLCALGTTIAKAGTRDAFRRIDHTLPLQAARLAHAQGTPTFALCSAAGAHPASRFFYNRVKGELERDLAEIGFESLTIVRPGVIDGERDEHRPAEQWALRALRSVAPLLPRAFRPSPAETIAHAMLDAALSRRPGRHVVDAAMLAD